MNGEYGIENVALSMPRMICADGVMRVFEVHLTDNELEKMHQAAQSVRGALDGAGIK